ncbi:hypothetical protein DUK53_16870 [Listeria sp. SHR_NRA_18]|uniref:hypothetical protein n=1 Tax=Listeria sp. SHR_NRA_18 TaxID=2269046 RepID=UPI000F6024E6|nr:hypothetical protein [Listeria sp. SHR_NRA_18]RQW65342.1 hypothetical protein DUK53_16870 [Listeria sp. SHR_NRA_18]
MVMVLEVPETVGIIGYLKLMMVCDQLIHVSDVETLFDYEDNNKSLQTFYTPEELAQHFEEELISFDDIKKSNFYYETLRNTIVFNYHQILRSPR